jgi:type I restriction enzyme S subunit
MASEWKTVPLGELYEFSSGISKPRSEFGFGHGFLSFKDVFYNYFVPAHLVELVNSSEKEQRSCSIKKGDVFLTRTSETMDELGMSCVALKGYECATFNGFTKRLRPNGAEPIVPEYAGYYFRSPAFRREVTAMSSMSTRASLNNEMLGRLRMVLPPVETQSTIGSILKSLDDKIELNRRMNATLEAMARALFQSWFIDFDPVRAKLDGRKPAGIDDATAGLFPATFQESLVGLIPHGWSLMSVADISARIAIGPFGSRITRDNFVPDGVPVVRGGNLANGFVDGDFVFLTEAKANELKASVAHPLDLVFTHRGTLGQVGIIPNQSRYPRYVVSQSQMLLSVDRRKASPWMIYLFFRSPIGEAALLANTSTTGVPAISRPTTSLKAISIVLPPIAISERFAEIVQPLFLKREQNSRESSTLSALRDTLLPKLLSGELSAAEIKEGAS